MEQNFSIFVKDYNRKYDEFFKSRPIQLLDSYLTWHSNGVLHSGIKAISFLFFCKFGEIYLNEAVYLIAFRLSELRNETQMRGSYLGTKEIFSEITKLLDQSISDSQFFALLNDPKKRYKEINNGNTAKSYWNSLHNLLNELSQGAFALEKINTNNEAK